MKIIHTADLHLDSNLNSNLDKDKAKERRSELLSTFVRLVNYASANDVDAILIAGDLFDVKNISATARNTVFSAIKANSDILFFYIKGNHDKDNFLDDLDEIPANLKLFSEEWTSYRIGEGNSIVVSGAELSASNAGSVYESLFLEPGDINIVMLHGQESKSLAKDKAEVINIKALKNKNIDYLALGHVHSYKEDRLDPRAVMCYSGCLDPRGFDECGEHGFVLLDIDENKHLISREFVPFASRHLYALNCDVSDSMTSPEMIDKVGKVIEEANIDSSDLVKIILSGELDVECERDDALILKAFENEFWFVKLSDETRLKVDYSQYALDKSLKGEFVRTVSRRTDIAEEDKARIIRYGITAIQGGEVESCD